LEFRDFGVFETKLRKARKAQNPKTLEPVEVPEKRTVKFKVGRLMKQRLAALTGVAIDDEAGDVAEMAEHGDDDDDNGEAGGDSRTVCARWRRSSAECRRASLFSRRLRDRSPRFDHMDAPELFRSSLRRRP
jgi:hypothetical protein